LVGRTIGIPSVDKATNEITRLSSVAIDAPYTVFKIVDDKGPLIDVTV